MRKTRIAGLLTAVVASAALLAIPAVSGANHVIPTKIKVSQVKPALHGVLASKVEACERVRLVVVKRIRPNRRNRVVGADWSSYNGAWSVDVNRNGKYAVKVRSAERSQGRCGRDKVIQFVTAF